MESVDVGVVLAWGLPRLRDLPWRATRDPWAILVAEVMLQQTQAERVVPKWRRFLDVYPTPAECAGAALGDVLRLWQGLGYPRRARNLHDAAAAIVERHGGDVPDHSPICSPCPASVPIPPGPSACSPSSETRRLSKRTSPACSPASPVSG